LYAHAYSSKFPPLTSQRSEKIGASLPEHRSNRTGIGGKLELAAACIDDVNPRGESARQVPANHDRQSMLAAPPRFPFGKGHIGGEDLPERRHCHRRGEAAAGFGAGANGGGPGARHWTSSSSKAPDRVLEAKGGAGMGSRLDMLK